MYLTPSLADGVWFATVHLHCCGVRAVATESQVPEQLPVSVGPGRQLCRQTDQHIRAKVSRITCVVVSARFIDASMYRDVCHAIRIAIQFARIKIFLVVPEVFFFFLFTFSE